MEVYLDLDGVLVDLERGFHVVSGFELKPNHGLSDEELWSNALLVDDFWLGLDKMHDADKLVEFVCENFNVVHVLSAPQHLFHSCKTQKEQWVEKHYINTFDNINIVPRKEKYKFAHSRAVLIDDYIKNVKEWEKHNGIGIQHFNTEQTIIEIKDRIL